MSFRSEFPFSSGRLGAVALAALLIGAAPLAGCQGFGDMTGSIASTRQPLPTDEAACAPTPTIGASATTQSPARRSPRSTTRGRLRALTRYSEAAAVMQAAAVKRRRISRCSAPTARRSPTTELEQAKDVLARAYRPSGPTGRSCRCRARSPTESGDHEGAQTFYRDALKIAPGEPSVSPTSACPTR
jgi:Flp pilus assembly protein TadD